MRRTSVIRWTTRGAAGLLCSLLAVSMLTLTAGPTATAGGGDGSPLLPPDAKFRGKSVDAWNVQWVEWFVGNHLASGSDIPDTVKKMRFLDAATNPGDYELDVTVKQGTGFVLPAMFLFGEQYDNGTEDLPTDDLLDFFYGITHAEIKLNGEVLLSGQASDLGDRHFGPTYFDAPIWYDEPQYRFDDENGNPVSAIGALWTFGVGAVYAPLPPGNHTLEVTTVFDFGEFGLGEFHYIYHIHVTK